MVVDVHPTKKGYFNVFQIGFEPSPCWCRAGCRAGWRLTGGIPGLSFATSFWVLDVPWSSHMDSPIEDVHPPIKIWGFFSHFLRRIPWNPMMVQWPYSRKNPDVAHMLKMVFVFKKKALGHLPKCNVFQTKPIKKTLNRFSMILPLGSSRFRSCVFLGGACDVTVR